MRVFYIDAEWRDQPKIVEIEVKETPTSYRNLSRGMGFPSRTILRKELCFHDRKEALKALMPMLKKWIGDTEARIKKLTKELREAQRHLEKSKKELGANK
jgi:hypothetical protein